MRFNKKSILDSKNYKIGKDFIGGVLKRSVEINEILKGLCKDCRKRAKRAGRGKRISSDYKCDTWDKCKPLIQKAQDIGMGVSKIVKVK